MAIAKAWCTCKTCGKEFEVRAKKYNSREARSFEKWAEENITECQDCENARIEKQRAEENAQAAAAAKDAGWPELSGSAKQVAWAETIRRETLALLKQHFETMSQRKPQAMAVYGLLEALLLGSRSAGWWIEGRDALSHIRGILMTAKRLDADAFARAEDVMENGAQEQPAEQPAQPERPIAVPEKPAHEGTVDLHITGGDVVASYEKDDTFRGIVKDLGFSWKDGAWRLRIGERTGSAENVCAELGSRLLNAGFSVRFDSQEILDRAVGGEYTPMHRRWIGDYNGFYITWPRESDLYHQAKALPGARYDAPGVVVPETSWAAVADFAEKYDFRLTSKAQLRMDRMSGAAQTVAPAAVREAVYQEKDVLKSSREVLEDLKD